MSAIPEWTSGAVAGRLGFEDGVTVGVAVVCPVIVHAAVEPVAVADEFAIAGPAFADAGSPG